MPRSEKLVVLALLFTTFFLPFLSMRNFGPVADEVTHLPSGYSYLQTGEIKLNPQHPPLIKLIAAFPLLFLNIRFNADNPNLIGSETNEWQFGRDFLSDNDVDRVLFWGRIPMALISVLLGWYVFRWGKELFSYKAGTLGLFIYAFMPNLIAHSQFVATDMGLATFSFISLYYFWRLLGSDLKNRKDLVLTGIFLGLALGSKFSSVFLLPIFLVLLAIYFRKKLRFGLQEADLILRTLLPIFGLSLFVIWVLYLFPSDPLFYYKGLKTVYADSASSFQYFLNGEFKEGGWWYYFIFAFIIKTPIPFLAVLLASLVFFRKQGLNFFNHTFILLPPALSLFMTSWKAHNIGVRYILVIYPFLILFVSGWLSALSDNLYALGQSKKKMLTAYHLLLMALGGWYVFSAVSVYPDYLSYFNELVGGSDNGYKYLDDSNIDWGQDLKRLAEYQKNDPDLKVVYSWANIFVDASKLYGIKHIQPLNLKEKWLTEPHGKYAVNTHAIIRFELASQKYNNEKLDWAKLYKPIDRIGQSFFIYEFP